MAPNGPWPPVGLALGVPGAGEVGEPDGGEPGVEPPGPPWCPEVVAPAVGDGAAAPPPPWPAARGAGVRQPAAGSALFALQPPTASASTAATRTLRRRAMRTPGRFGGGTFAYVS